LGPILSIFGLLFGPKGLQIGFPNAMVSFSLFFCFFSSALGPIQGLKVQHLLVTWGRLKSFFSISAFLTP
jgi:hypothetical protein